jgi:hypothetical protein
MEMPTSLTANVIERIRTPDGIVADLVVVEPNGDRTYITCTVFPTTTEVDGDGELLAYLNERYGDVNFCQTVRKAALGLEVG